MGQGVRTAWPIGDTWTSTLRDKTAATHRAAAERGVPLRVFVKIRPDHYRELPDSVARPGFDDGWLMAIPRARFEGDRARYASAGWGVGFADIVSPAFVARVLPEGGSTAPCLYGYNEARDKQFVTVGALTDLRNPAYRRWQIAWVQELMRFTGADGVTIGVKSSWHASPMTKPVAAPGNAGGPLSQTPYGPGEFERAMGDYVVELAATGVPVTVVEGAVGPSGRFGWVTPAVRNALLGVVRFREPSRD